jgi:hypothetical protein
VAFCLLLTSSDSLNAYINVRETLARVFYLTSEKMLAKDNQSSFQEYLQATFWLTPLKLTHTCVTLHNQLLPSSGLAWTGKGYK